eukprot:NODE_106_length_19060_cov_0.700227.p4 type:complete len:488 gc:universal NODE_106_length_19060_cov_0.700227:12513-13976(+)
MSTWNQIKILQRLFYKFSRHEEIDMNSLDQILINLSSPFPKSWCNDYFTNYTIGKNEFIDFILNVYNPKRKEWIKSLNQIFLLFKDGKIASSEFYKNIAHILSIGEFEKIEKLITQMKFNEVLELLLLDDILNFNSGLAVELANSPCISYASRLLKKIVEFSDFSISVEGSYTIEITLLHESKATHIFSKFCDSRLQFEFQLSPGILVDIITNALYQQASIEILDLNGIVLFFQNISLSEFFFEKSIKRNHTLIMESNIEGNCVIQFEYRDYTQDKYCFEQLFDAFQITLRQSQYSKLKNINRNLSKKLDSLYQTYPSKTFPVLWMFEENQTLITDIITCHENDSILIHKQAETFSFTLSNKLAYSLDSLDIISKLKHLESKNVMLERKGGFKGHHISIFIRSIRECYQERRMSALESVIHAFGHQEYRGSELVLGWKNGYPMGSIVKLDQVIHSGIVENRTNIENIYDEISIIVTDSLLYFFTGNW